MQLALSSYEFKTNSVNDLVLMLTNLGVQHVELWPHTLDGTTPEQVRRIFDRAGIKVSCVSAQSRYRLNSEETADAQQAIFNAMELATFFGADFVTTYLGTKRLQDPQAVRAFYKESLQPCLDMAAQHGITILLENMFDYRQEDLNGTALVRTPEGLRSICESFDAATFGLTYDPANFYLAGVESFPFAYEALHKYIRNVHVKDAYKYVEWLHGSRDGLAVWPDSINGLYVSVPPGQGAVNWYAIMRRLHRDQYAGFLTVDILTTPNNFQSAYRETVQYLQSLLQAQNG